MDMITKNIFRPLPSLKKNNINLAMQETGVETDEQESDPAWPHIRGVYEIFLQLIVNEACDVKSFKSYITNNFISEVINITLIPQLVPSVVRFRRDRRKRFSQKYFT